VATAWLRVAVAAAAVGALGIGSVIGFPGAVRSPGPGIERASRIPYLDSAEYELRLMRQIQQRDLLRRVR
jgi:hypothetical protein